MNYSAFLRPLPTNRSQSKRQQLSSLAEAILWLSWTKYSRWRQRALTKSSIWGAPSTIVSQPLTERMVMSGTALAARLAARQEKGSGGRVLSSELTRVLSSCSSWYFLRYSLTGSEMQGESDINDDVLQKHFLGKSSQNSPAKGSAQMPSLLSISFTLYMQMAWSDIDFLLSLHIRSARASPRGHSTLSSTSSFMYSPQRKIQWPSTLLRSTACGNRTKLLQMVLHRILPVPGCTPKFIQLVDLLEKIIFSVDPEKRDASESSCIETSVPERVGLSPVDMKMNFLLGSCCFILFSQNFWRSLVLFRLLAFMKSLIDCWEFQQPQLVSPPKCMYSSGKVFEMKSQSFCRTSKVVALEGSRQPQGRTMPLYLADRPQERAWQGESNSGITRICLVWAKATISLMSASVQMEEEAAAPLAASSGREGIAAVKACFQERRQWRTFSLAYPIPVSTFLIEALVRKCLPVSIMTPRWGTAGSQVKLPVLPVRRSTCAQKAPVWVSASMLQMPSQSSQTEQDSLLDRPRGLSLLTRVTAWMPLTSLSCCSKCADFDCTNNRPIIIFL